jgi:hypothetical protein
MDEQRTGYPGAPPGWYPDPAGGTGRRWWDGYAWSEAVVLPTQAPVPPPPPPGYGPPGLGPDASRYAAPPRPAPGAATALAAVELRLAPAARVAYAVPGIYLFVNLISIRVNAAQYRALGHQFDLAMKAAQHNRPAPPLVAPDQFNGPIGALTTVVGLCAIAAVVIACIWQARAASTARALGYPAHHRPGWGVAFWFIPIVNYWMPYQAIRDCLAPDNPGRPLVLRWWLTVVTMWTLTWVAAITACFSESAALVVVLCGGLACLGTVATSPRVVASITGAHQAAVSRSGSETAVLR